MLNAAIPNFNMLTYLYTEYHVMPPANMLSFVKYYYAECHYAVCHSGGCRYAECHYAQCR